MIFKHELRFVAFTWPNLRSLDLSLVLIVLVGRNFVSGIFKLKPEKPRNLFFVLKTYFLSSTGAIATPNSPHVTVSRHVKRKFINSASPQSL